MTTRARHIRTETSGSYAALVWHRSLSILGTPLSRMQSWPTSPVTDPYLKRHNYLEGERQRRSTATRRTSEVRDVHGRSRSHDWKANSTAFNGSSTFA